MVLHRLRIDLSSPIAPTAPQLRVAAGYAQCW